MNKGYETGSDFVKWLRPVGAVVVLLCFVGFLAVCFSSGRAPIAGFAPAHDTEYYSENITELVDEINESVVPKLDGIVSCTAGENAAIIEIKSNKFYVVRAALIRYYDESLLDLRQLD